MTTTRTSTNARTKQLDPTVAPDLELIDPPAPAPVTVDDPFPRSVFTEARKSIYRYRWEGEIFVRHLVGGTPRDQQVARGYLQKKLGATNKEILEAQVTRVMVDMAVTADEAVETVAQEMKRNGFKRTSDGQLYLETRCLKAGLKEASNICWPRARWGKTNMGTQKMVSEHIFVEGDELLLNVWEPTGEVQVREDPRTQQRFVVTFRGTGIAYEEVVDNAHFRFTVYSDIDLDSLKVPDSEWGELSKLGFWPSLWGKGEDQGIGSVRSQGFGRYGVIKWDRIR